MSNAHRPLWALALMAIATCGGERAEDLLRIDLEVPAEISRRAEARAAGDAAAPTPVLLLEDVEIGTGERLSLQLVDPDADPTNDLWLLAQATTVGTGDGSYGPPIQPTTLVFPLNERGCRLLAGKLRIRLALRVEATGERPPLRYARARFDTDGD